VEVYVAGFSVFVDIVVFDIYVFTPGMDDMPLDSMIMLWLSQ